MLFDMSETEIFIPTDTVHGDIPKHEKIVLPANNNRIHAFPQGWENGFGQDNYRHLQAREIAAIDRDGKWDISEECRVFQDESALNITSEAELSDNIKTIMSDLTQRGVNDGN